MNQPFSEFITRFTFGEIILYNICIITIGNVIIGIIYWLYYLSYKNVSLLECPDTNACINA